MAKISWCIHLIRNYSAVSKPWVRLRLKLRFYRQVVAYGVGVIDYTLVRIDRVFPMCHFYSHGFSLWLGGVGLKGSLCES